MWKYFSFFLFVRNSSSKSPRVFFWYSIGGFRWNLFSWFVLGKSSTDLFSNFGLVLSDNCKNFLNYSLSDFYCNLTINCIRNWFRNSCRRSYTNTIWNTSRNSSTLFLENSFKYTYKNSSCIFLEIPTKIRNISGDSSKKWPKCFYLIVFCQ